MRRQQKYSEPILVSYALAEIESLKTMLGRVTDGRVLVHDSTGGGGSGPPGGDPGGPIGMAPSHVIMGSRHTRSLRVTDGGGLNADFEEGIVRVDETIYSVVAGTIALTGSQTNYIFINNSGAVAVNITGFPNNSIPLATAVTDVDSITTLTDQRSYMWGHHGPIFEGNVRVGGYARVGSVAAPVNTTAGDLTVGRLNIGNLAFLGAEQSVFVNRVSAVDEGYAGIWGWIENAPTVGGAYWLRGIDVHMVYDGAFNNSTVVTGATFTVDVKGTGKPAFTSGVDAYGVWFRGGVGAPMSAGVVRGFATQMFTVTGRTTETIHVDTLIGFQSEPGHSYLVAGDSVDEMYGYLCDALGHALVTDAYSARFNLVSGSPGLNIGLRLDGATTAAVWFNTDTTANGLIAWGTARDTNLYRGAANVIYSDDSLRLAGHVRVGATAIPTNATAGDLTVVRFSIGNAFITTGQVGSISAAVVDNTNVSTVYHLATFTPTIAGAYEEYGWWGEARYLASVDNTSTISTARFDFSVGGTGKPSFSSAVFGVGLVARGGAGAAMSAGSARALSFQMFGSSGRVAIETIAIDALYGVRIDSGYSQFIAGDAATVAYGLWTPQMGHAQVTDAYGLFLTGSVGSPGVNIGAHIGACTTAALWFNTDTAGSGLLTWGTARDVNLYRSAANILATDDSLAVIGGVITLGADVTLTRGAANRLDLGVGDALILDSAQFTNVLVLQNTAGAAGNRAPNLQLRTRNGTVWYMTGDDTGLFFIDSGGANSPLRMTTAVVRVNATHNLEVPVQTVLPASPSAGFLRHFGFTTFTARDAPFWRDDGAFHYAAVEQSAVTVPQPYLNSGAVVTQLLSSTTAIVGRVHLDTPVLVATISYDVALAGSGDAVTRLVVYTADGNTKVIDVTDAVGTATGVRVVTLGASQWLHPGDYYFFACFESGTTAPQIDCWQMNDQNMIAGAAGKADLCGTFAIVGGVAPATFDETALTTASDRTPLFRLDA